MLMEAVVLAVEMVKVLQGTTAVFLLLLLQEQSNCQTTRRWALPRQRAVVVDGTFGRPPFPVRLNILALLVRSLFPTTPLLVQHLQRNCSSPEM